MSNLATYSPEDVIILLGGVYRIEGLAEGSFISIAKNELAYKTTATSDGRVSRTKGEDPTHTVKITLSSFADSNLVFTAMVEADGLLHSAVIPFFMKDALGTTTFYAPMCWIEQVSDVTLADGITGREWTLRTAGGVLAVGGNESGSLVDTNLAALGFIAGDFAGLFN